MYLHSSVVVLRETGIIILVSIVFSGQHIYKEPLLCFANRNEKISFTSFCKGIMTSYFHLQKTFADDTVELLYTRHWLRLQRQLMFKLLILLLVAVTGLLILHNCIHRKPFVLNRPEFNISYVEVGLFIYRHTRARSLARSRSLSCRVRRKRFCVCVCVCVRACVRACVRGYFHG